MASEIPLQSTLKSALCAGNGYLTVPGPFDPGPSVPGPSVSNPRKRSRKIVPNPVPNPNPNPNPNPVQELAVQDQTVQDLAVQEVT